MRVVKNWHTEEKNDATIGERAADRMRNGMGSWPFVLLFIVFMAGWAFVNTNDSFHHWDKYPFILLNLFLSMLAALQGAILLIAAKRADAISAAMAQHDYDTNTAAKEEIETLMRMNKAQLEAIEELKKIVESQHRSLDR